MNKTIKQSLSSSKKFYEKNKNDILKNAMIERIKKGIIPRKSSQYKYEISDEYINTVRIEAGLEPIIKQIAKKVIYEKREKLKILSWNLHGLKGRFEDGNLEHILILNYDIICLQECSITSCSKKIILEMDNIFLQYGYTFIYNDGMVGILIKNELQCTCPNIHFVFEENVMVLQIDKYIIINVYISHRMHPNWKPRFFDWITTEYKDKLLILIGDFNTILSREDCRNPFRIDNYYGAIKDVDVWNTYFQRDYHVYNTEWLNHILYDLNLEDRFSNIFNLIEDNSKFTTTNSARLDYILVSNNIVTSNTEIIQNRYGSDHNPISIQIT